MDLDELKKLIKTQNDQITALIQAETANSRLKEELQSTTRKLEKVYADLKVAEDRLVSVKSEASHVLAEANQEATNMVESAKLTKAEADRKLSEASRLERQAQAKLDEAQDLSGRYQSLIADLNAQKEKILAAIK